MTAGDEMERDPMIERVRETLRTHPAAVPDERAVGRVLAAVWAAPRPSWWQRLVGALRTPTFTRLGAGTLAAGALLAGFAWRGALTRTGEPELVNVGNAPTADELPIVPAAYVDADVALVPTQFVFEHATAKDIALVGDFNEWKPEAAKLTKLPNGLWTVTVALPPGRHVYSYMLDGTLLVADPRAPKVGDADYGHEGSVVMVFAK